MEHSTAILNDASKTIEKAAKSGGEAASGESSSKTPHNQQNKRHGQQDDRRKRKGNFKDDTVRHGGGGGRNNNKRHKKGDLGRGEYFASNPDKRQKNEDAQHKRVRDGAVGQGVIFSKEEIDAEQRRPKHKVAVMIGYSGTGYKGMQISGTEKTIEGDLFLAFVKAGAISKANAEDPKKSSFVRCARTDKGVHAAGNMISLKLIMEDPDIIEKINAELSPQIRVWGIERTIGSFSCYQACDSRWYEYLIPSHAFLPPHPSSWLAKQLEALADEAGDREGYEKRQEEVKGFWEEVDAKEIKEILETIDVDIRWDVVKALQGEEEASAKATKVEQDGEQGSKVENSEQTVKAEKDSDEIVKAEPDSEQTIKMDTESEQAVRAGASVQPEHNEPQPEKTEDAAIIINEPAIAVKVEDGSATNDVKPSESQSGIDIKTTTSTLSEAEVERLQRLRAATKLLRNAYLSAKRRYRIPMARIERIQAALAKYVGTRNYHNYTIQKTFKDPSVKRHIKSFVVNRKPILIGDGPDEEKTEWLSLKVHGQSFMMHQIRKMVGMVTLIVRSGASVQTMEDSFTAARYSIPKVPGLGLLLERPVFDTYNTLQATKHGREQLKFSKYEKELEAFKEREIYQRIFREEEERNEFGRFFNHVDNFREQYFLFVTSKGLEATKGAARKPLVESDAEGSAGEN